MNLESLMLTAIRQRKTSTVRSHLYVESEKAKLIEMETEWWLPRPGDGVGGDVGTNFQL